MLLLLIICLLFVAGVVYLFKRFKTRSKMPIISITNQPATNTILAAYRPIVLAVTATRTDSNPEPPVVYGDVYVNGAFRKTVSKTISTEVTSANSKWYFDIQDTVQEVLNSPVPVNGQPIVLQSSGIAQIFVRFRSSGYDTNGFLKPEGTAPKQGTGKKNPVSGTGTQSKTFFVINATLQHPHNQELAAHLNSYKTGSWASGAYPLSHRSASTYKVCKTDSDYFPILNLTGKTISCLRVSYKNKGSGSVQTITSCGGCVPVSISGTLPAAVVDTAYSRTLNLGGSAPFSRSSVTAPSWLSVAIDGAQVRFTGTPTAADMPTASVSFTVTNECGSVEVSRTIEVQESCDPVHFLSSTILPDGQVGQPYSFTAQMGGTPPYSVSVIEIPEGLSASIAGDQLQISGTPTTTSTGAHVYLNIINCAGAAASIRTYIAIAAEDQAPETVTMEIENNSLDISLNVVTVDGNPITLIPSGLPLEPGDMLLSKDVFASQVTVYLEWTNTIGGQSIVLYDSQGVPTCIDVSSGGNYPITLVDTTGPNPIRIELVDGTCI